MELDTLKLSTQDTLSVPEMRAMLGVGKTESYWILKQRNLKTVKVSGHIRIVKKSFDEWYDHQVKYNKVDGSPPGQALREMSYSTKELAEVLNVSGDTVLTLIHKGVFETFTVDYQLRITKESFELWYASQRRFMNAEDRKRSEEILTTSYSMPEIARMLGIHRNSVYGILNSRTCRETLDFIVVGGQKRITIDSFNRWFAAQTRYELHKPESSTLCEGEASENVQVTAAPEEIPQPASSATGKNAYSADDIKKALCITKKEVYEMIATGRLDAIRTSRGYIIPRREYERITSGGKSDGNDYSEK